MFKIPVEPPCELKNSKSYSVLKGMATNTT